MKLKTVRVRRSSPSAPALALALMLTMLCVYLVSLSALPEGESNAVANPAPAEAEVRMEGLEAGFLLYARTGNRLESRVQAARCANAGGAGLILSDGSDYCVISEAVSPENTGSRDLRLQADGLTLKLRGSSSDIAAVSEAVALLRTLASETGGLSASIENGNTDLPSVCSLMEVYRTRSERALKALRSISSPDSMVKRLDSALQASLSRIESALASPDLGKIKLIHAAGCGEWISLLEEFAGTAA